MFKDDVLSERKDRERAQAQRDKLRRDLEILQSRNQSLQEQVYKYQEHIMRLNTGDRRVQQDFIPQHQVCTSFVRLFVRSFVLSFVFWPLPLFAHSPGSCYVCTFLSSFDVSSSGYLITLI